MGHTSDWTMFVSLVGQPYLEVFKQALPLGFLREGGGPLRGSQIARQWKIIRFLEASHRGITASDLSERLEVPVRTVYRDLEAIQDAGFPIYTDRTDKNVYWKMIEGFTSDIPLPVTATELMALHMGRDFLKVFEGTVFQESIASFFCKVKSSLSPEMLRYLRSRVGRHDGWVQSSQRLPCVQGDNLGAEQLRGREKAGRTSLQSGVHRRGNQTQSRSV